MSPRVVIGAPLYGGGADLPVALDSLLGQSHRDLAIVAVDDGSGDGAEAILAERAANDDRLSWRRNPERIGMAANWRLAFEAATARHPEAEYFAWASDHDVWEPGWLETLVAELDAHPEAVLAYPAEPRDRRGGRGRAGAVALRHARGGRAGPSPAPRGVGDEGGRHGLRPAPGRALRRAGVFPDALWPDRLLLAELSAQGTFRQVPQVLWSRRFAPPAGRAAAARQRHALFAGPAPLAARLPWWLGHVVELVRRARDGDRSELRRRLAFAARYAALVPAVELCGRCCGRASGRGEPSWPGSLGASS